MVSGCTSNKQDDLYSQILKRDKIIVGVKNDTRPFGFVDLDGVLKGFDVDLAKYIAKSILGDETKVEFVPVTTSNRIMMLNSGHVDMIIATMSITPKREEIVSFSNPYYIAGQTFLVPNNSKYYSASDLNNKKIIVVFGSTAERNLRLILPESKLVGFKTYPGAVEALKRGQADAMASDDTILLGIMEQNRGFRVLPKRYTKEPYAVSFKKTPQTVSMVEKVNMILEQMHDQNELDKLRYKWVRY